VFDPSKPWAQEEISVCRRYRYQLWYPTGVANPTGNIALGVFANPSTATANELDPTMTRWLNYCRAWGYRWAGVVNVRAYRATDPKDLPPDPEAIGPENGQRIIEACHMASLVVCGWGKLGGARGLAVLAAIRSHGIVPTALKLNRDGSPGHPLYLRANLVPTPMRPQRRLVRKGTKLTVTK
jgi:hypothetical protein